MSEQFNKSLNELFEKMESYVSTKTVVGEPVHIGDVIIVPLVDVIFGLGGGYGGGGEGSKGEGGGSGVGAKITPSAVLVVINNMAQVIPIKNRGSIDKLIDMVPGLAGKVESLIGGVFSKDGPSADPGIGANPPDAENVDINLDTE